MISVIIPVLNESQTIASVVAFAKRNPKVTEVIVIDDGSIDGTPELAAEAEAKVIVSTLMGKGASMEDGMWAAQNDILLYLDGDLTGLCDDLVERMTSPLLSGESDFVKARFSRSAGRVTVLAARPLLLTFFPELSRIEQPLGGIIATRRSLLRNIRFEMDYGVDVGLLLDLAATGATITQADIGHISHENQTLEALGDMAIQVVRVILDRAACYGRLDSQQLREVQEVERQSQAEMSVIFQRMGHSDSLALFDMDGTLLKGRFVINLAQRTNKTEELGQLLDNPTIPAEERTTRIAALFSGVARSTFEEAARTMPLAPGAAETVVALRKLGYRVGIVSDSFRVATEIVRRRVFADFSIAHLMRFRHGIASGDVLLCPAMFHDNGCSQHKLCKQNALLHVCEQSGVPIERVLAVGDGIPDACMLRAAGLSVAYQPKSEELAAAANHVVQGSLIDILPLVGNNPATESLPPKKWSGAKMK